MIRKHPLTAPLIRENPVTLNVLGVCAALAITNSLTNSLVMSAALTTVLVLSNASISLVRRLLRLVLHQGLALDTTPPQDEGTVQVQYLDGEIADPLAPQSLPSGDGLPGGSSMVSWLWARRPSAS